MMAVKIGALFFFGDFMVKNFTMRHLTWCPTNFGKIKWKSKNIL